MNSIPQGKALSLLSSALFMTLSLGGVACEKSTPPIKEGLSSTEPTAPSKAVATAEKANAKPSVSSAVVGQPAPDFSLADLTGQPVSLSEFKGKTVVLEWFNPGCPFIKASHARGSLVTAAADAAKDGVVWLAINSSAPGKQGSGAAANEEGKKVFHLDHPILLDETGAVGRLYGATNTPHLFIIDAAGALVYAGAVDNSPDGEGEEPQGGHLVSYVGQALAELKAGQAVSVSSTKAYGCSIKY